MSCSRVFPHSSLWRIVLENAELWSFEFVNSNRFVEAPQRLLGVLYGAHIIFLRWNRSPLDRERQLIPSSLRVLGDIAHFAPSRRQCEFRKVVSFLRTITDCSRSFN